MQITTDGHTLRPVKMFLLLLLFLTPAPTSLAADAPDELDTLLARYQELGLFNGSALVAEGGEIVIAKGYGLANMEWDIPNTPDTKFRSARSPSSSRRR